MTSDQKIPSRRVIQRLDEVIRSQGWGAIRSTELAIGKRPSWWHGVLRREDLKLGDLLALLDHLGLDEGAFLRRALDRGTDGLALDRPPGKPPPLVCRVRERLAKHLIDPGLGSAFLEALDFKREEDPEAAVAEALWAVDHLPRRLLPRLLGVGGSAYKTQMLVPAAYHSVHFGIALAREGEDALALADLLQRLGYVVAEDEDYRQALRLAERAAWIFLRQGELAGVGKALVDQGIWLHYLGRTEEAIRTQEAALELLPPALERSRYGAHQCLGQFHYIQGQPASALAHLEEAEALVGAVGRLSRAKLVWLKAGILEAQGDPAGAEEFLLQAIETLSQVYPVDTALATCDLVALYLEQGRPTRAHEATRTLLPLLEPLRHHKVVSSAIAELLRCEGLALDLRRVQEVRAKIAAQRDPRPTSGTWRRSPAKRPSG